MIGAITGLILLVALLGVLFYCTRMLLPLISPALRILVILLVAIVALYVVVALCRNPCADARFSMTAAEP
jgi:hypothetical protein